MREEKINSLVKKKNVEMKARAAVTMGPVEVGEEEIPFEDQLCHN